MSDARRPARGRSTYGICDFALSWWIREGKAGVVDLSGLAVVMAGYYDDDEPSGPWRVTLYVDDRARGDQADALAAIFLGRAGGGTFRNFAQAIQGVYAVRNAKITIDHTPGNQRFSAGGFVNVVAGSPVHSETIVACGIPGLDRPGTEVRADVFSVKDEPLGWDFSGRAGFATGFAYTSEQLPPP